MSAVDDFLSKFDESGRFRDGDGTLDVVFMTSIGKRYPGILHFSNGLCSRVEMQGSSPWEYPDRSPLNEIKFLLYFEGEPPLAAYVDQGRIIHHHELPERLTKKDFLTNFRVARNLFVHPQRVVADSATMNTEGIADSLARAAIWLTPKSVAGFNASHFPELGLARQMELQTAVQNFLAVANQVPSDKPATAEQYGNASVAFRGMLEILQPDLPMPDEAKKVEKALREVTFPPVGCQLGL
jgi:hypothetical protein